MRRPFAHATGQKVSSFFLSWLFPTSRTQSPIGVCQVLAAELEGEPVDRGERHFSASTVGNVLLGEREAELQ
jgi:hypothetical protein